MPRQPKPWRRAACGGDWYAQVRGRQVPLAKASATQAEAWEALYRALAEDEPPAEKPTVPPLFWVFDEFIDRCVREFAPATVAMHTRNLRGLSRTFPGLLARDLRPHHVLAWLNGKAWAEATRRAGIVSVKASMAWAAENGLIPENPIAKLRVPSPVPRADTPTHDQVAAMLKDAEGKTFGELIAFLVETGARLGEAIRIEAGHCHAEAGVIVLPDHKTAKKTGKPRVIVLSPRATEIVAGLIERYPEGPIFRNHSDRPWNRQVVSSAFRRLRKRTGMGREATAHALRHRFATDGVAKLPNGVVAALLGHTSTRTVDAVYSKIGREWETLRAAAGVVRPGSPGGEAGGQSSPA
jgi:integrase